MSSDSDCGFFKTPITPNSIKPSINNYCHICKDPEIINELLIVFKLSICFKCKRDTLKFITKTTCFSKYLLDDNDLKRFNSLSRPNPHKGNWSNMNLFLESDIIKRALEKYGSLEEIEKLVEERMNKNIERKRKKMKKVIREYKSKIILKKVIDKRHVHSFERVEQKMICKCGLVYEEEEI